MDAVARLGACAVDAVGRSPKEGWQDALILACDDVEEVYDELLAELIEVVRWYEACLGEDPSFPQEAEVFKRAKEAIAKAKGGE